MQCDDEVETEKRISASGPEGLLLRSSKNVRGDSPRNKLAEKKVNVVDKIVDTPLEHRER